jgi:uncharacterized membrane-anchored protein YitT (DUF2179 family)
LKVVRFWITLALSPHVRILTLWMKRTRIIPFQSLVFIVSTTTLLIVLIISFSWTALITISISTMLPLTICTTRVILIVFSFSFVGCYHAKWALGFSKSYNIWK